MLAKSDQGPSGWSIVWPVSILDGFSHANTDMSVNTPPSKTTYQCRGIINATRVLDICEMKARFAACTDTDVGLK